MEVKITHYSIRSRGVHDGWHPQHWIVQGSMDGQHWIELDRQNNRTELVGLSKSFTFPISKSEFVRMIRVHHNGTNSSGTHHLILSAFELFGTLRGLNV
jgi:hypothetical protein